jgi:hypothetical protein
VVKYANLAFLKSAGESIGGGSMVRILINSMIVILIATVTFSGTALSATVQEMTGAPDALETSSERNQPLYNLVTLPSTNKKRVDAMCLRFLSLLPKAKLIPETSERRVYRLVAKTYDTIEPAKRRKAELLPHCESPFVLKNDYGYTVIAGSQLTEALAVAEQKRLAAKNISTAIVELRLPLKQWRMKSTESFTIRDAVIMASRLAKIGVITTLEPAAY